MSEKRVCEHATDVNSAAGSIIREKDIGDRPCSCGPATAATSEMVKESC